MKFKYPGCIIVPVAILISLAIVEFVLYHFDPLGYVANRYNYHAILNVSRLPSPDGWRYVPGIYYLNNYTVVIGLDGFRAVPTSNFKPCKIVFVGDSVTFGQGSNISFVDVLAPDIPATVINAGFPAYSAENVEAELNTIPANGYVWTMIDNDAQAPELWKMPSKIDFEPAITTYIRALRYTTTTAPEQSLDWFNAATDKIIPRDDVLVFAFADQSLTRVAQANYPGRVHVIPLWTERVSAADAHPSDVGHQQIADAMHDTVVKFAQARCG